MNLLFVAGVLLVAGVVLRLLLPPLTRPAWRTFGVGAGLAAAFAVGHTLALGSSSALARWTVALGVGGNPPAAYTVLLALSAAGMLAYAVVCRAPFAELARAAAPFALPALTPFLRYLASDTAYPTPTIIWDVLLLLALAGALAGWVAAVERRAGRAPLRPLLAASGAAVVVLAATLWPLPGTAAWLRATAVTADYGAVVLTGYRAGPLVIDDAEPLRGALYWRLTPAAERDLVATVALVPPNNAQAVTRLDIPLRAGPLPTTRAWPPGLVFATPFELPAPPLPPSPEGYRLTVAVRTDNAVPLAIVAGDRETLTPDAATLVTLPVLPADVPAPPANTPSYTFDDGITLSAATLQADGRTLELAFWWGAVRSPGARYTQLLHVYPPGAETPLTFDAPPFGGALATGDWFDGFRGYDTRTVTLPADGPPGVYRVYTGLYDSGTLERLAVRRGDEPPLPDAQVLVETVMIR